LAEAKTITSLTFFIVLTKGFKEKFQIV
ncbi:MAG: hypothetical protein PWQ96_2452, partial [Clostridia bacterium]|nr:hypothetical protein [Clostridia bacterium]